MRNGGKDFAVLLDFVLRKQQNVLHSGAQSSFQETSWQLLELPMREIRKKRLLLLILGITGVECAQHPFLHRQNVILTEWPLKTDCLFLAVTGTWKDPVPGWVENLNGPTGLLVGAGKGVIRSMHCRAEYNADIMPCDIAINAIIILAWKVANLRYASYIACIAPGSSKYAVRTH
jgi:hypothetical protein